MVLRISLRQLKQDKLRSTLKKFWFAVYPLTHFFILDPFFCIISGKKKIAPIYSSFLPKTVLLFIIGS